MCAYCVHSTSGYVGLYFHVNKNRIVYWEKKMCADTIIHSYLCKDVGTSLVDEASRGRLYGLGWINNTSFRPFDNMVK